ncbi:MAG: ECF-type sigma factor [Gemmatimonadota bacterium]
MEDESLAGTSGPPQETVTRLLGELRAGDRAAFGDLFPLVDDELHQAALKQAEDPSEARDEALVALDHSLRRLESLDERQSRIVECRFFGSMTIEDTAEALGISPATVKRSWASAQAWLYRDLKQALEGPA